MCSRRSSCSCPRNSTRRATFPDHPHSSCTPFLADHSHLSALLVTHPNGSIVCALTAIGIGDPPTVRVALITFVVELDRVVAQMESGRFIRGAEVDRIWEGLDRAVVVVDLQILDRPQVAMDIPVDADACTGLGLENEGSTQSDDLGNLHDERVWIRR